MAEEAAARVERADRLQPIRRNPAELGSLDLFASLDAPVELTDLASPDRLDDVLAKVRTGLATSLANESRVRGWHAQQMFAQVVKALNKVVLLTEEDQGNTWVAGGRGVQPPDFRIVLNDGSNLLVEVKNHFGDGPESPFVTRRGDLGAIQRYAELAGGRLMYAIYWAQWGQWTLVDATRMTTTNTKATISLASAMSGNEMASLGDYSLWTLPPLSLVLEFDDDVSGFADGPDGSKIGQLTIRGAHLEAAGRVLLGETERRLAWLVMLYSDWHETLDSEFDGDILKLVRFDHAPETPSPQQDVQGAGFLSQLFSNAFIYRTTREGGVQRLGSNIEGFEIAPDFTSTEMKLVRMVLQPTPPLADP